LAGCKNNAHFSNISLAFCLRDIIVTSLKIVLGGTTGRRSIRCGGLYLFGD
jgi:hypothetical protein